jgi:DNA-binding NtrC family response regulator
VKSPLPRGSSSIGPAPVTFRPIEEEIKELERRRITAALEAAGGNQTKAAELIQMPLRTFQAKLKQYDPRGELRRRR